MNISMARSICDARMQLPTFGQVNAMSTAILGSIAVYDILHTWLKHAQPAQVDSASHAK